LEDVVELSFGLLFVFCGLGRDVGHRCVLRVDLEERLCLQGAVSSLACKTQEMLPDLRLKLPSLLPELSPACASGRHCCVGIMQRVRVSGLDPRRIFDSGRLVKEHLKRDQLWLQQ